MILIKQIYLKKLWYFEKKNESTKLDKKELTNWDESTNAEEHNRKKINYIKRSKIKNNN
jgi:hypothetical protein